MIYKVYLEKEITSFGCGYRSIVELVTKGKLVTLLYLDTMTKARLNIYIWRDIKKKGRKILPTKTQATQIAQRKKKIMPSGLTQKKLVDIMIKEEQEIE